MQTYTKYIKSARFTAKKIRKNKNTMYFFNFNLIKELPRLFGMSKLQMCKHCGLGVHTLDYWSNGNGGMPVGQFVDFLNILHLSMADFLVPSQTPVLRRRKEDYVIPEEIWKPVEWKFERVAKLYGPNSSTGVGSKKALVESIGMKYPEAVVSWATERNSMKISVLVSLLNRFRLDARDFLVDGNRNIEIPVWETDARMPESDVDALDKALREVKALKAQVKDRDNLIANMTLEVGRLKRENDAFRSGRSVASESSFGFVAEEPLRYRPMIGKRKYLFHKELWQSLPGLFDKGITEFRKEFGISNTAFYENNVKMDTLIRVCNELHVSITHFFPPEGEPLVVHHRDWYEISPRLFQPIESRMENLKYIFRQDTFGFTLKQLTQQTGISFRGAEGITREDGKGRMVLTMLDICNSFSLPMSVFVHDPNDRKRPAYSVSQNETLIENCVKLAKALKMSREEVKALKARLKGEIQE